MSALKWPSSGSTDTFYEPGQQNACPDVPIRLKSSLLHVTWHLSNWWLQSLRIRIAWWFPSHLWRCLFLNDDSDIPICHHRGFLFRGLLYFTPEDFVDQMSKGFKAKVSKILLTGQRGRTLHLMEKVPTDTRLCGLVNLNLHTRTEYGPWNSRCTHNSARYGMNSCEILCHKRR